jgi:hypothetical protein
MTYKWLVTFSTPASKGMNLKETVEGTDWFHAKALMESRYPGIRILNYTPVR